VKIRAKKLRGEREETEARKREKGEEAGRERERERENYFVIILLHKKSLLLEHKACLKKLTTNPLGQRPFIDLT
jgi:hypothetical protein